MLGVEPGLSSTIGDISRKQHRKGGIRVPLYDYECELCGHHFEVVCTVDEMSQKLECPKCRPNRDSAYRVLVPGHGGVQLDAGCAWIDDEVRGCLQPGAATGEEKPIETRSEWKQYLKDHPNIDPIG